MYISRMRPPQHSRSKDVIVWAATAAAVVVFVPCTLVGIAITEEMVFRTSNTCKLYEAVGIAQPMDDAFR